MKLNLDDDQQVFLDAVRTLLNDNCSPQRLTEVEASDTGLDEKLWSSIVSSGWTALAVPEASGGLGMSLETMCVIVQEIGNVGCATPLVCGLQVASLVRGQENDDRVNALYEYLLEGETVTHAGFADAKFTAESSGSDYLLSAQSVPVLWGHLAKAIVVLAKTSSTTSGLFLLEDVFAANLIQAASLDNEPVGVLTATKINVGAPLVVFDTEDALDEWLAPFRILQAALLTGCAQKLLNMTVDYVEVRKQFGRTLGSLPTVHQVLADVAIEVDGARLAVGEGAVRFDEGENAARIAGVASYWAGVTSQTTAIRVAQLHGAIGFMKEFPLQLFFRRAKAGQLRLGTIRSQQDMLARLLLPAVMDSGAEIAIAGVQLNEGAF